MTDLMGAGDGAQDPQIQAAAVRLPLAERYGIPPAWWAVLSLLTVFVTYQITGSVITHFTIGDLPGPGQIGLFRTAQAAGQVLLLFLPTLALIRWVTLSPRSFLRLNAPKPGALLVSLAGIFSLQQVLQIYLVLQDKIPLPPEIQKFVSEFKQVIEELFKNLLAAGSPAEFLGVLVVVAVVPAISEELLFRGLIQRCFEKGLGPPAGIALTGIIFGAFHLNPFEFVPLALLGVYLGFIAYRANSLWISIAAHFFNNAMACFASYFQIDQDAVVTGDPGKLPPLMLAGTLVLFGSVFIASTTYFIRITAPQPPSTQPATEEPAI